MTNFPFQYFQRIFFSITASSGTGLDRGIGSSHRPSVTSITPTFLGGSSSALASSATNGPSSSSPMFLGGGGSSASTFPPSGSYYGAAAVTSLAASALANSAAASSMRYDAYAAAAAASGRNVGGSMYHHSSRYWCGPQTALCLRTTKSPSFWLMSSVLLRRHPHTFLGLKISCVLNFGFYGYSRSLAWWGLNKVLQQMWLCS